MGVDLRKDFGKCQYTFRNKVNFIFAKMHMPLAFLPSIRDIFWNKIMIFFAYIPENF